MRCPNCDHDNPEGRRYCEECGERMLDLEARKARARRRSQREAASYRREVHKEGLDAEEAERRRRRTRKRTSPWVILLLLAALAAVIVVIVLTAGGGKSGPERAVKDFYHAIKEKDLLTYLKHTELDLYKMAVDGDYEPDPYSVGIDYDSYNLEGLTTRLVKEEGDHAEVEVIGGLFEGIHADGSTSGVLDFSVYPRVVRLVRIEGVWIVQDYNMMKLPWPLGDILPQEPEFPELDEME